jgi:hypothetical protein
MPALVRTIIQSYIQPDHTVIGVVMAMSGKMIFAGEHCRSNILSDDPANAAAVDLARAADPTGKRTIGACHISYSITGCRSCRTL